MPPRPTSRDFAEALGLPDRCLPDSGDARHRACVDPLVVGCAEASHDWHGEDEVRKLYGPKYERLAEMKCKYDPQNLFHRNANIVPAV